MDLRDVTGASIRNKWAYSMSYCNIVVYKLTTGHLWTVVISLSKMLVDHELKEQLALKAGIALNSAEMSKVDS